MSIDTAHLLGELQVGDGEVVDAQNAAEDLVVALQAALHVRVQHVDEQDEALAARVLARLLLALPLRGRVHVSVPGEVRYKTGQRHNSDMSTVESGPPVLQQS